MATTAAKIVDNNNRGSIVTWTGLTEADTGAAVAVGYMREKTVIITGTFAGGMTVIMEGSNDGVTYAPVSDEATAGTAVSFAAAGMKKIRESPVYLRPRATAGAAASVIVTLSGANVT